MIVVRCAGARYASSRVKSAHGHCQHLAPATRPGGQRVREGEVWMRLEGVAHNALVLLLTADNTRPDAAETTWHTTHGKAAGCGRADIVHRARRIHHDFDLRRQSHLSWLEQPSSG